MARLSRRLWGGTSLKTAAKEAKEKYDNGKREVSTGNKSHNWCNVTTL